MEECVGLLAMASTPCASSTMLAASHSPRAGSCAEAVGSWLGNRGTWAPIESFSAGQTGKWLGCY